MKVDHSTAGALFAVRVNNPAVRIALMFAIAGHHAGLANYTQLKERFAKKKQLLTETLLFRYPANFSATKNPPRQPYADSRTTKTHAASSCGHALFSALVDAGDFLDTEAFMAPWRTALRSPGPSIEQLAETLRVYLERLEREAPDTQLNRLRAKIRAACSRGAQRPPGLFRLTVPTGGGKTLAGLSFALEHCRLHGLA